MRTPESFSSPVKAGQHDDEQGGDVEQEEAGEDDAQPGLQVGEGGDGGEGDEDVDVDEDEDIPE